MSRLACRSRLAEIWLLLVVTSLASVPGLTAGTLTSLGPDVTATRHTSIDESTVWPLLGDQSLTFDTPALTASTSITTTPTTTPTTAATTIATRTAAAGVAAAAATTTTETAAASYPVTLTAPATSGNMSSISSTLGKSASEVMDTSSNVTSENSEAMIHLTTLHASSSDIHIQSTTHGYWPTTTTITSESSSSEQSTEHSGTPSTIYTFTNETAETATAEHTTGTDTSTATETSRRSSTTSPHHTATTPRDLTSKGHNSTAASTEAKDGPSSGLALGAEIAIIVVFSTAGVVAVVISGLCLVRRRRQVRQSSGYLTDADFVTNNVSIGDFTMNSLDLDD